MAACIPACGLPVAASSKAFSPSFGLGPPSSFTKTSSKKTASHTQCVFRPSARNRWTVGVGALAAMAGEGPDSAGERKGQELEVGSPIIIIEAPPYVKTAEPMPMMRLNEDIVKVGDAGRILDKRPKDVWAIRFATGAYLLDRKYFSPLET